MFISHQHGLISKTNFLDCNGFLNSFDQFQKHVHEYGKPVLKNKKKILFNNSL